MKSDAGLYCETCGRLVNPEKGSRLYLPLLDSLTPEQMAEFRRGMAALRRKFARRMKRRQNAPPQPRRDSGVGLDADIGNPEPVCADCGSDLDQNGDCKADCALARPDAGREKGSP